MEENLQRYFCINCGGEVESLYKKYSSTVLKLTQCKRCNTTADKYVEYDIRVVLIDLILLRMKTYRHILLNMELKSFWKLSIILLLLEAYSQWTTASSHLLLDSQNTTTPYLIEMNAYEEDFKFYILCLKTALKTFCFVIMVYAFTKLFFIIVRRELPLSMTLVWKTVTVSSSGLFLLLPSLIWDVSVLEFHQKFVLLYTTLSQLLAYTALCNCPKLWSLIVILTSYRCTLMIEEFFEIVTN